MTRRVAALLLLQAMALGASSRPVSADPIAITGGQLAMGTFSGQLSLSGERGFTLTAGVAVVDSFFGPYRQCNLLLACVPGAPIDLGAAFVGSSAHATTVTLDGQTFTNVTAENAMTSAGAWFTGSTLLPALTGGTTSVVAPFTFEGLFRYPSGAGVIQEGLFGQGTATVTLRPLFGGDPAFPPRWEFVSAQYEFSAVPEPATILLTASGMIGVAGLRRRVRRGTRFDSTSERTRFS